MDSVDPLTLYFLKKMREIEVEIVKDGGKTLGDVHNIVIEAAPPGFDPQEAAERAASMAIELNVHVNLTELVKAVALAGRVLCQVADPEETGRYTQLASAEELQQSAQEATKGMAMLLEVLREFAQTLPKVVDCDHIAASLIEDHKQRAAEKTAKAEPKVTAKPVSGTVDPLGKRFSPSQN